MVFATYLLNFVCRTVQTDPSCVQDMQGTPVSVMLQRTFRCRHFSQAMEARERRVDMLILIDTVRCCWRWRALCRPNQVTSEIDRRVDAKQTEPRRPRKPPFQLVAQGARWAVEITALPHKSAHTTLRISLCASIVKDRQRSSQDTTHNLQTFQQYLYRYCRVRI